MAAPQIEVVKGNVPICSLGEAPHWCQKEQVLYFVDIFKSRVLRYNPLNEFCNYVTVSKHWVHKNLIFHKQWYVFCFQIDLTFCNKKIKSLFVYF